MKRRVRFVLHGNTQRGLLLVLAIVVAVGMLAAAWRHDVALEAILEQAAFSAHLSAASSGSLVWRAIAAVTLASAGASLLIGCLVLIGALWSLERLFRALSAGLERLARGERASRLPAGRMPWGGSLARAFNRAAESMDQRANTRRALLDAALAAVEAEGPQRLAELRALQTELRHHTSL